ncbi:MAG: hypothetical protein AAGK97_09990, partial [Bacteroidota bacterium]
MKPIITLLFFILMLGNLDAQTFYKDVAPIIYDNCTNCHRDGEIGPMSLANYNEVKDWGGTIKYVTGIKYMPPWKPDPSFSTFLGESYLTDEEIQTIADWVDNGMEEGNPNDGPDAPVFPDGSQIGTPDLVLSFSEAFEHYGGNKDEYRNFVIPTGLTEDKEVAAIEVRPGNTQIVHHTLISYDVSGEARNLDAQDQKYGYDGFGGFGVADAFNVMFPGYVPGQKARLYQQGLGRTLPANSDILLQMHYAPVPFPQTDSSSINIFFKKEPLEREVRSHIMLPLPWTIGESFIIRPEEEKTFHGVYNVPEKISMVSVTPHMHLIGTSWDVFAVSPSGDTTNLISIPEWDFNWQGSFHFDRFKIIERGSKIHAYASYDNTSENPLNPNNPPRTMEWGENTTDEMYFLPLDFVLYQEGDEDVVFNDGTTSTEDLGLRYPENKIYPLYPNPTNGIIKIGFSLGRANKVSIRVLNLEGQL